MQKTKPVRATEAEARSAIRRYQDMRRRAIKAGVEVVAPEMSAKGLANMSVQELRAITRRAKMYESREDLEQSPTVSFVASRGDLKLLQDVHRRSEARRKKDLAAARKKAAVAAETGDPAAMMVAAQEVAKLSVPRGMHASSGAELQMRIAMLEGDTLPYRAANVEKGRKGLLSLVDKAEKLYGVDLSPLRRRIKEARTKDVAEHFKTHGFPAFLYKKDVYGKYMKEEEPDLDEAGLTDLLDAWGV